MPDLILVRHGQSAWNLENRFTGWTDVDLSPQGEAEARQAGELIRGAGLSPDAALTSVLKRAVRTLWIALDVLDLMWLPVLKSWRLNERHYGALQGLDKAETAEKYGQVQVQIWRRSYDTRPPLLEPGDPRHPGRDRRYHMISPKDLPVGESLKDTLARLYPFWEKHIRPPLLQGKSLLICAHGNSIRALLKRLMSVSDEDIPNLEIPTGNPLLLELSPDLRLVKSQYLDQNRATSLPDGR